MRVVVAAVGKPRDPGISAAIHEYEKRAARYWPFDVHEVREESARSTPPALVTEREGDRLFAKIPEAASVVVCDATGDRMTSEQFARWLQDEREKGRTVAFAIGGAYGLSQRVKKAATRQLSLAPWTLPHEIARLVLTEQIYRAGTIVRGEPYHK